jgi:L-rhamnose isomerase
MSHDIEAAYKSARQQYADLGIDTEAARKTLIEKQVSLPCWQGDDIGGFERPGSAPGGGLAATGNYPFKARNAAELRQDLEEALLLIPCKHRVNLHAMYGEFGDKAVDRNEIGPAHFAGWLAWAKAKGLKLDFNATLFAHPKAAAGFTLSSPDEPTRRFWIEHVRLCRQIAAAMGQAQQDPCVHNLWIPDGTKDSCTDRQGYRRRLRQALDEIYQPPSFSRDLKDSLESKLFGIGSESFVVGSFEFYLSYAQTHRLMLCLDTGHFHPTESVADKLPSLLFFTNEILLHVSRGVRWDSDHVPVFDDSLRELCLEIVRCDALNRVHMALDFFDASINRIAAWVIGARAVLQALLFALLEPRARLLEYEATGNYTARLALLEHAKTLPWGTVWDYYCLQSGAPVGLDWLDEVRRYETETLSRRG